MWSASKIAANVANKIQVEAGTLLKTFDISDPAEPEDADIICATTGDFTITTAPETEDFFEDVNNAPNGTMEGKRITGWTCSLAVSCLDVTTDTLSLALGAADVTGTKVSPRRQYETTDFKSLYWIGDMVDEDKLLVVEMLRSVSTGGLVLTTTKNGKGNIALTIEAHSSLAAPDVVPMNYYILEKVA